jgi:hypothetical protein
MEGVPAPGGIASRDPFLAEPGALSAGTRLWARNSLTAREDARPPGFSDRQRALIRPTRPPRNFLTSMTKMRQNVAFDFRSLVITSILWLVPG